MHSQSDKNQEKKSHPVANGGSPKMDRRQSPLQIIDNRPERAMHAQLQELGNGSTQAMQLHAFNNIVNHGKAPIQLEGDETENKKKRSFSVAFGENQKSEFEPPTKRRKLMGIRRLRRTNRRNTAGKATPERDRDVYGLQQLHNYGYDHKEIDYGDVQGSFYKGPFGGQPYLRIDKDDYGLTKKPKTNYDDIVKGLEKYGDDSALANIIIGKIREGVELPEDMNKEVKANVALLIQLTQLIEPHDTRIPGMDKLARSFFERIASGDMTFRQVFNREDGLFVVARAKGGGSRYGGQEAGRTLLGLPAKKSDKSKLDEVWSPEIDQVAEDMSDSSEEEEEV